MRDFDESNAGQRGVSGMAGDGNKNSEAEPTEGKGCGLTFLILLFFLGLAAMTTTVQVCKPVIYLYPEKTVDVSVRLDYNGELEYTYPRYEDGWRVTAHPDGTLVDRDGREYSYLFREGKTSVAFDLSKGFVVRGADTVEFLREKLAFMGLTPREYNEFIVYWMPLMEKNPWNLISFQEEAYTRNAVLTIEPRPDSVLRIYMTFRPLNAPVAVPPQELKPFERNGFAVVEWGGSQVR